MDANEYQKNADSTDLMRDNALYHLLGLFSEVGELTEYIGVDYLYDGEYNADVAEDIQLTIHLLERLADKAGKLKKVMRDNDVFVPFYTKYGEMTEKELGDIAWYLATLCSDFKLSFGNILKKNNEKLLDRMKRDVIKGSGDNR